MPVTSAGILASRASSVFEAKLSRDAKPTDKPTFYARVLFTPESMASAEWKALVADLIAKGREHFGKNFDAMFREGGIRSPIRRDVATKGYDADVFGAFLQVKGWEDNPPFVLSRRTGQDGKFLPITDRAELYPGASVRLSLRARAYGGGKTGFSPGLSLDLVGIQKLKDGPRLVTANGDGDPGFGALEPLPEDAAGGDDSLESMLG